MNQKLKNPKVLAGAAVGFGLVLAAAGWLLLVSPKRSEASELETKIAAVQTDIATRRAALDRKPKIAIDVRSSDLFRLTKAVPDHTDVTGIILELNRQAKLSGVTFESIAPTAPVAALGYNVQPFGVVVNGRFGQVSDFMNRLRKLVTVRKGKLDASGRLFTVDSLEIAEDGKRGFPMVQASVTVDAVVYAGGAPAPGTTPTDTTTPPAPRGAVAAGATP